MNKSSTYPLVYLGFREINREEIINSEQSEGKYKGILRKYFYRLGDKNIKERNSKTSFRKF